MIAYTFIEQQKSNVYIAPFVVLLFHSDCNGKRPDTAPVVQVQMLIPSSNKLRN